MAQDDKRNKINKTDSISSSTLFYLILQLFNLSTLLYLFNIISVNGLV